MTVMKILMITAILGHLLCGYCDCLMIYMPSGKFGFQQMKDGNRMRETFRSVPLRNPMRSIMLGVLALFLCFGGYYSLCLWMRQFSVPASVLMLTGIVLFFIPGTAHHVICGVAEWFYIRMGMTEEARKAITEFFRKTAATMIACYLGLILFSAVLFFVVVTGRTSLPAWSCVFNVLLIASVLFPMRIGGAANWAGASMFLGLLFVL